MDNSSCLAAVLADAKGGPGAAFAVVFAAVVVGLVFLALALAWLDRQEAKIGARRGARLRYDVRAGDRPGMCCAVIDNGRCARDFGHQGRCIPGDDRTRNDVLRFPANYGRRR